jgi:hypothetical protein
MEDKKQCFVNKFTHPGETTFWRDDVMFLSLTWASRIEMSAHKGLRLHVNAHQVYKSEEILCKRLMCYSRQHYYALT